MRATLPYNDDGPAAEAAAAAGGAATEEATAGIVLEIEKEGTERRSAARYGGADGLSKK
jgi:hypothetical protein